MNDRFHHYGPLSPRERELLDLEGDAEAEESASHPERDEQAPTNWRTALQAGETRRALE